ncbi:hypothetical protein [Jeotgalibacillus malaysiensis]|uniref:hypothetical protein n=1 Tax=Jeotgalibacillus malaysiensis TaxID=1508404 RepID=UPI00384BF8AE
MAVNAKEVVVNFNSAVNPDSLFDDEDAGTLTAGIVSVDEIGADTELSGGVTGELSEDGETLTLTAANFFEGTYSLTVSDDITTTDGEAFEAYSTTFEITDETDPTVTGVTDGKSDFGSYK